MHTMGMDFFFANAHLQYKNMDILIDYINSHKDEFKVEILYSTPSQYVEELNT